MAVREWQIRGRRSAAVLEASAEQRELDVLALVQARERADAVGRRVAGDEQDGLHRQAGDSASGDWHLG
jgi:hypothetical protein